jgi:leucine-zipper of insertion element IS481/Integrase core domain
MDIHKNARLTLRRREELVQQVSGEETLKRAAARFNVSAKTVAKWVHRYRALGSPGLLDRSSRPLRSPRRTSSQLTVQVIALRRQLHPAYQIAQATGLSTATVSRILQRAQLNRWRHLHPAPPVVRYEHSAPGDLLHLDIKGMTRYQQVSIRGDGRRRGRPQFAGWQALHVAIDDHSRLAFSRMLPNQKTETAIAFLHAAVAFYAQHPHSSPAHRQRQLLSLPPVPSGLRSTRHSSPLHSPLHATHQRQSRTLHPDRAPRVGLCPPLLRLTRTRPTTCPLARLLQLSSSPW